LGFAHFASWAPDGSKIAFRISGGNGFGIYSFADNRVAQLNSGYSDYVLWLPDGNTLVTRYSINYLNQLTALELGNFQITVLDSGSSFSNSREPDWFPDNNFIAFSKDYEIWAVSLATGVRRPLLNRLTGGNLFYNPTLSCDGKTLVCDNGHDIFKVSISSGECSKLAVDLNEPLSQPAWSPNNKQLACRSPYGLRIFNLEENKLTLAAHFPGAFLYPSWSVAHPVFGSHIAFERDNSIYLLSLANGETKMVIPGGRYPSWSPDGTKIAYVYGNDIYVSTILVPFSD
jgi:Tol biopolymer transport system component